MKRNIIAISLMAAGLFTFGNVYADENYTCKGEGKDYYRITLENGDYQCPPHFTTAIKTVTDSKETIGEITLLKDTIIADKAISITKDVTIDLGGNTMNITSVASELTQFKIIGANVTFKNGTLVIDSGANMTNLFHIDSSTGESSLTIADDVTIKSEKSDPIVKVLDATHKTAVNVNGIWNIKGEIVDCNEGKDDELTVNLAANVNSESSFLSVNAGVSVVNILGGEYTSKTTDAIMLKNGTLNISGGTITAIKGNAINIAGHGKDLSETLNITGGNIIAKNNGKYAINFAPNTADGEYSFAGGTYTSGKKDGKYLPAINIVDPTFLTKQSGIITGGTYNNGIVGEVPVENGLKRPAANAISTLLGANVTATTDDKGNVVVTTPAAPSDPTNPEQTGSQAGSDNGTGDNTIDDSPQTYDGIMSYVTMALTSVGAVALSLKKVLSR